MAEVEIRITQNQDISKPKKLIGVRHFQCFLLSGIVFITYIMHTFLAVAIISMTEKTSPDASIPTYPEWDNTDTILSSLFWGYIVPQVGAGQLSEYFGPKWFLVATMVFGSVLNLVIPAMAATFGSTGVIVCRILQGLNQGFLFPCSHNLISRWTPTFERTKILSFVYGGANLGTAAGMLVTGIICGSNWGWPGAFYFYGALGIAWAVIFAIFVSNTPAQHKTISEEERRLIEGSTSVTATVKKVPTPWTSIVTSLPVWAIFVSGISMCFGGYTLLTEIPSYMNGILDFDIQSNSALSALPYLVQYFVAITGSPLSDFLINHNILSRTVTRKVATFIGSFLPAAALIYLAFLKDFQKDVVVGLLIVAAGFNSLCQCGYMVNIIDIAPNHSGTLFGMVNGCTNIFSILAPLVVGFFGNDKKDPMLWRNVFLLSAGIWVGCGIFYLIFATSELQSWNDKNEKNKQSDKK